MKGLAVDGFDWDDANRTKCQKHGLALADIEAVFAGEFRVAPDVLHSGREVRLITIGRGDGLRPIFVVFTLRHHGSKTLIRPISARYMRLKEVARYEKARSENESAASEDR